MVKRTEGWTVVGLMDVLFGPRKLEPLARAADSDLPVFRRLAPHFCYRTRGNPKRPCQQRGSKPPTSSSMLRG